MPDIEVNSGRNEATTHLDQMGRLVRTAEKGPTGPWRPSFHKAQVVPVDEPDDVEEIQVAGLDVTEGEQRLSVDVLDEDEDEEEEIVATRGARELAEERDVPLEDLEGSGRDGRIVQSDVEDYIRLRAEEDAKEANEEDVSEESA